MGDIFIDSNFILGYLTKIFHKFYIIIMIKILNYSQISNLFYFINEGSN